MELKDKNSEVKIIAIKPCLVWSIIVQQYWQQQKSIEQDQKGCFRLILKFPYQKSVTKTFDE